MTTRTGPQALTSSISRYSAGSSSSLSSLRTARLIRCQRTSTSRTFSTSSTQREVIQAQEHSGSNQKSTRVMRVNVPTQLHLQLVPAWKDAEMTENKLHREEAAARAALLTVQSYDVELDLCD